jgi:OHS family lactose permease-like MFS transporter
MITSNKNYFISCLFFLFFFIGWGCCYPYLSLWLTETIGINYTDVGILFLYRYCRRLRSAVIRLHLR